VTQNKGENVTNQSFTPSPTHPLTPSSSTYAILGGGILGMTLAHRLAQAGQQVTLFESAPQLGGLASAWEINGITWDRHYHVTLLSDSHLRALLTELDLDRDMKWVETKTGFFMDGKLYSMSSSLEFLKFPPLSLIDKFRLGATIFYASKVKDWKRLEKISVTDWLTKLSGRNVFDKMWRPLLRAKLGENYQDASAAFIWAIIARMYAARRSGLKKEMFGYLPGGYGRMLERFGQMLAGEGVELCLGCTARSIEPRDDGSISVELNNHGPRNFDRVIVTTPSPIAAKLCSALSDQEKAKHNAIRYQGIICASLLIKQPLANYYVTNLIDGWVPFTAVIEMSALVDRNQFGGNSLIYLPKYVDPADPMFEQSDEQIEQSFVAALERMYPHFHRDDVIAMKISRVRRVLAISTLNYSENLPPMATSVPGLHIINSAHIANGTLNVNETVQLANTAAADLLNIPRPSRSTLRAAIA
jgi:protoporphyrinogen oxidase